MHAKQHINGTLAGRARTALKMAIAGTILSVGLISAGGSPAHAGNFVANGSAGLQCGTGYLSLRLPVVQAYTSGVVVEVTQVLRYNGAQWVDYAWTGSRYASLGAGQSQNGAWTEVSNGQYTRFDSISVFPGAYYYLVQWVYVDGSWIAQASPYCFA